MSKVDPRMAAIGDVDEANSAIGVALLAVLAVGDGEAASMLGRIQNEMFDLGADFATPAGIEGALRMQPGQTARLEREIDRMNADLEPLKSFILPGGAGGSAQLHLARAVARRAERSAVAAAAGFNPDALAYLNRLSDHLFVLARWVAREQGGDILWQPGATRGA